MNYLGPFVAGEQPFPHVVTFTDDAGGPLNLTGMAAKWIYRVDGAAPVARPALVTNGPGGEVTYDWVDADLATPGLYVAEMWCGTAAGEKLASKPYRYYVRPAVAVPVF